MKNLSTIFLGIAIIVGALIVSNKIGVFGAGAQGTNTYYSATETTVTLPRVATTTGPVASLNASRMDIRVCYVSGTSTIYLHQLAQSTTTGWTALQTGIPMGTSTSGVWYPACQDFPGFRGYLFGLSTSTAVVSVTEHN